MNRILFSCGLLLLTCLARSSGAAEGHPARTYQAGGTTIDSGFVPDEAEIILGQPLFITFTVTNRSQKPYRFFVGGDIRGSVRHNSFRITAVDARGKPVKDPHSYNHFGGPGQDIVLETGKSYSERLFLGHWCAFGKPGVYTVTCERVLRSFGEKASNESVPVISSFQLTVASYDKKRIGDVIAGLGNKLRGGKEQALYEASLALAAIPDERVIPHLALSLGRGEYPNKLSAIQGLAQLPTDAAARALITALKDSDHVVRDAGGDALRRIKKTDLALQSLFPELEHESSSVRALAAQALGATRAKGALNALLKATRDPDPAVRHAAAMGLGTLGHKEALQPLKGFLKDEDMGMRVAASKGLHALGERLDPGWLTPVIRAVRDLNNQDFHEAIRLIRMYGGEKAAHALVGCLDFDDPSLRNSRNMFLILAIHHTAGGPQYYYKFHSDPNTDGTARQIEENRKILAELKEWHQGKR